MQCQELSLKQLIPTMAVKAREMGFRGCLHSVCQRASILDEEGVIHFFEKEEEDGNP